MGYHRKTILSPNQLNDFLIDYVNGVSSVDIRVKYKIGLSRYNNIICKYEPEIERLRVEIAKSLDAKTNLLVAQKRHEILNSISETDIKNAKLKEKSGSAVDLTQIKRLESGQSTENISLNINNLNQNELMEFIKTGKAPDVNDSNRTDDNTINE